MLNYDEIVTQAGEHRSFLLATAEQQRLAHSLVSGQPHPFRVWIGQQLIRWGQQLRGEQPTPSLPARPVIEGI